MTNNDMLRSLRFALNINDKTMADIFRLAEIKVTPDQVTSYLADEEDPKFQPLPARDLSCFLNAMVIFKRGKDESRPPQPVELPITNNLVLKRMRVAFMLKEEDVINILKGTGFNVGRSEVSAFFRKSDHINYRSCGDQFLRNFFKGLPEFLKT